eukprot:Plantae.Rhodophyta-Hildenbrandia_rubra.ctg4877.p1 GENE.Plantae.Rhodophyta-Hildenbrandia_rubra.ctg4877~~Plantae.Rhodophyta-Hildenbrandia_rubra.ctg4877.p1  ORF type:complete len:805 (-),score=157.80 Plantae.Rhodophyta-Hildenbrandia_rubra.ctg4877:702-3116(-)
MEVLSQEAARKLLLFSIGYNVDTKLSDEERTAIDRIVGSSGLDGQALAIRQASLVIHHNQMSLVEYAAEFDELGPLESISQCRAEVPNSLNSSWASAKRKLSKEAKELLSILCWLSPHDISVSIGWKAALDGVNMIEHSSLKARYGSHLEGQAQGSFVRRRRICLEVLNEMVGVGLVEIQNSAIKDHRLMYLYEQMQQRASWNDGARHCALESAARLVILESKLRKLCSNSEAAGIHSACLELKSRQWGFGELVTAMSKDLRSQASSAVEAFRVLSCAADLQVPDAKAMLGVCILEGSGVSKNEKKGAVYLQEAVSLGSVVAFHYLGRCYKYGVGVEKDVIRATQLFSQAVDTNNSGAMGSLGHCYALGIGVKKDAARAVELFKQAVYLKNSKAISLLGHCYKNGIGVEEDVIRAAALYKQAAELNNPNAMWLLGKCYEDGGGIGKDTFRAAELYKQAANLNDLYAMRCLGKCYEFGIGVEKDVIRAAELYKRGVDLNYSTAMRCLGRCYENGVGVEKNVIRAVELYKQSADLNNVNAMRCLGRCYEVGIGVEKNMRKALGLHRKAVDRGDCNGMRVLGRCFEYGNGVEKNEDKAFKLYSQAAILGGGEGMWNLGRCFRFGKGVVSDEAYAVELYRQAMADQETLAMDRWETFTAYRKYVVGEDEEFAVPVNKQKRGLHALQGIALLAHCYANGVGTAINIARSLELYAQAVELGDVIAMVEMGKLLSSRNGMRTDERHAVALFRRAANHGYAYGMLALGDCYEKGAGVELNSEKSHELYKMLPMEEELLATLVGVVVMNMVGE